MTKVIILGANGQLARNTIPFLLWHPEVALMYLRGAQRLKNPDPGRVTVVEGDVLDSKPLRSAMRGQHVVYAKLGGS